MKSTCINCKYYQIEDEISGYCRITIDGKAVKKKGERPMVRQDHSCEEWRDCGQQYYIRLGWIKSRENKDIDPA